MIFFCIFTSSRPLNGGKFFIFYFKVDYFINCNISAIHNGLIRPLWIISCENIVRYIGWEIIENLDFPHIFFSWKNENFTTYCMYLFDHNFSSRVVTSTYEPILVGSYGKHYGKMLYSPKYSYENSQGAWELVKLWFFLDFH